MGKARKGLIEELKLNMDDKNLGKIIKKLFEVYSIHLKILDHRNNEKNYLTFKLLYIDNIYMTLREVEEKTNWGSIDTLKRKIIMYKNDIKDIIINFDDYNISFKKLKSIIKKHE